MRRLLLLRHAKSTWKLTSLSDFDRPLSKRGERAAPLIGRYLRENSYGPERILCSTSVRTRQTLQLVVDELERTPRIDFLDRLYDAGPGVVASALGELGNSTESVMVIGHNPSMQETALNFCRNDGHVAIPELSLKYPTAGLCVIDFDSNSWSDAPQTPGKLRDFVIPRSLEN